jgi:hypothetical protein
MGFVELAMSRNLEPYRYMGGKYVHVMKYDVTGLSNS